MLKYIVNVGGMRGIFPSQTIFFLFWMMPSLCM